MPLNALRAFAAVFETGGVRPAGRELGIAHSAISRHLVELEAWLGVALTEPTAGRKGLALTAHGQALGAAVRDAFGDLENAALRVIEARTPSSVVLSVAPSFASRWLLPRLLDFEARHPKIELSIAVDQRPVTLEAGRTDIAIRMSCRRPTEGQCEPMMDDQLYPVMSPKYWQCAGKPTRPEQLKGLRLIHDRDPDATWGQWRATFGPNELDVRSGPRYTSSDLVLRAAAKGLGVALARHQLAQDDLETGTLIRPIPDQAVQLDTAYWIIVPERPRVPRNVVKTVVAWIKHAVNLPSLVT